MNELRSSSQLRISCVAAEADARPARSRSRDTPPGPAEGHPDELRAHPSALEARMWRALQELDGAHEKSLDLSQSLVACLALRDNGLIIEANAAAATLLGVERSALTGQHANRLSALIVREDRDLYYRFGRRLLETEAPQVVELRLANGKGAPSWVRMEGQPAPSHEDGPRRRRVVLHRIPEQKTAEVAWRERIDLDASLTELVANVPGAVFQYRMRADGSHACPYVSAGIMGLYGVAPEMLTRGAADLFAAVHPDDRDHLIAARQVSARSLRLWQDEHRVRHPDKGEIWVEVRATPEREPEGGILWHGFLADITQRKRTEQMARTLATSLEQRVVACSADLAASNRELETFSYAMAHDLSTPLRAIDGFSHLLEEEFGTRLDGKGLDYLHRIRAASRHLGMLIDDILVLSRVGRQPIARATVDLSTLAGEIGQRLQERTPGRGIEWIIAPGLEAKADPALARIVLDNLLGNAWKFTGERDPARIELGRSRIDLRDVFYVRDNGAGFDMTYADKLFQPFQRLHDPGRFEGTGIGLAIVLRIVHHHGGCIWADSRPGEGAAFYFALS